VHRERSLTVERLQQELPAARRRAEAIARRLADEDPSDLLEITVTELAVALEEVAVATGHLTSQQEQLAELREAAVDVARRNRELFDASPDAQLLTRGDGVIAEANEAAMRLLGEADEKLRGKPLTALSAESRRREVYDAMDAAMASGRAEVVLHLKRHEEGRAAVVSRTGLQKGRALHWRIDGAPPPPPRRQPRPVATVAETSSDSTLREELEAAQTLAAQLQRALDTRVIVEQAKGCLAERHGITPVEAYERLRRMARAEGRRVHDLAAAALSGETDIG
jgi:PAS domain S-box-containing protein